MNELLGSYYDSIYKYINTTQSYLEWGIESIPSTTSFKWYKKPKHTLIIIYNDGSFEHITVKLTSNTRLIKTDEDIKNLNSNNIIYDHNYGWISVLIKHEYEKFLIDKDIDMNDVKIIKLTVGET